MGTRPRIHITAGELGRGRQDDSSSSRESSPRQERSFSPVSDDGDIVVVPVTNEESSEPQPERPLLRQPVAFATPSPSNLKTYQATLPSTTASSTFLPGQAVAPPRKRKTNKTATASKRRKPNDYAGQTSRFRLKMPSTTVDLPDSRSVMSSSIAMAGSASTLSHNGNGGGASFQPANPTIAAGAVTGLSKEVRMPEKKSTPSTRRPETLTTQWKVGDKLDEASGVASTSTTATNRSTPVNTTWVATNSNQPSSIPFGIPPPAFGKPGMPQSNHGFHHRRDPSFHDLEGAYPVAPSAPRGYPPATTPDSYKTTDPPVPTDITRPAAPSYVAQRSPGGRASSESRHQQKLPLVMLTLLIQDIRSGVTDHQLAEVKLPMKPASNPNEGFWVDAKLLGQQLQSSASRVDGPAKVYTLRGKYRQFFLRVTAEGLDEFISTDLAIKPDRILDVVVEELPPPGQLPLPPRIPQGLVASPRAESSSRSPSPERESYQERPLKPYANHSLALYRQPSLYSRKHDQSRTSGQLEGFRRPPEGGRRNHSASSSNSSTSSTGDRRSIKVTHKWHNRGNNWSRSPSVHESISPGPTRTASTSAHSIVGESRFDASSNSQGTSEEVHRLVSEAVCQIIREDPEWTDFLKARAALEPHRVLDVIVQYRFFKRIFDQWSGKRAPLKSQDVTTEHSHITRALKIDDPQFASNCMETLALLELYGPNGRRREDVRVVELVNDTGRPAHDAKPIESLLHLMQEVDKRWKEDHTISDGSMSSGNGV